MTGRSSQLDAVGCDVGASSPWERRAGPNTSRGGTQKRVSLVSTPFLCARAKKWGGTGSRGHKLPPKKTAHPHQAPDQHQPLPKVGRGTSRPPTCSAHANGGAAKVKKRFSLAARHRFFGQAPKKWGRMAGQAIDYHPTYRRTRRRHNDESALSCAVTCAPSPLVEVSPPCCPFHPISLLLRKETGWSPKETRLWVPPR